MERHQHQETPPKVKRFVVEPPSSGSAWLTSDNHWQHLNVIGYCNRPFKTVEEMDDVMVERWNARVKPGDTVFHCGDFALGKIEPVLAIRLRLNGRIVLFRGNHDRFGKARGELLKLEVVEGWGELSYLGKRWHLSHHPPTRDQMVRGAHHLCGHVHEDWRIRDRVLNVGVDQWDFRPLSFEEALEAQPEAF